MYVLFQIFMNGWVGMGIKGVVLFSTMQYFFLAGAGSGVYAGAKKEKYLRSIFFKIKF